MRFHIITLAVVLQFVLSARSGAADKPHDNRTTEKRSTRLVIAGTVGSIYQMDRLCLLKCWGVDVRVVKVLSGQYADERITFAVHSPARMGLKLGETYKIEAEWKDEGWFVREELWPKWPGK